MTTYRDAGVDIAAGDALVAAIKPAASATQRAGVLGGLGGFGALFDLKAAGFTDPILVSSTDGVGTKLMVAIETGLHDQVGIDLVAMCVNDLVVQGAEPLFFLDYFATGQLRVADAALVVRGIAAITIWQDSRWARPSAARCCLVASAPATRCSAWSATACIPTVFRWCGGSWIGRDWPGTMPPRSPSVEPWVKA
jgi:hypothetical protein